MVSSTNYNNNYYFLVYILLKCWFVLCLQRSVSQGQTHPPTCHLVVHVLPTNTGWTLPTVRPVQLAQRARLAPQISLTVLDPVQWDSSPIMVGSHVLIVHLVTTRIWLASLCVQCVLSLTRLQSTQELTHSTTAQITVSECNWHMYSIEHLFKRIWKYICRLDLSGLFRIFFQFIMKEVYWHLFHHSVIRETYEPPLSVHPCMCTCIHLCLRPSECLISMIQP